MPKKITIQAMILTGWTVAAVAASVSDPRIYMN